MFACLRVCGFFALHERFLCGYCDDRYKLMRCAAMMMRIAYGYMSHMGIWAYGHTGMGMGNETWDMGHADSVPCEVICR